MKTILFLVFTFVSPMGFAATSTVTEGPFVNLKCSMEYPESPSDVIEIQIREVGPIQRNLVPQNVPATFIDGMVEDRYLLREFKVSGRINIKHGNETLQHTFNEHSFYGALSFPDIADGFDRVAAYNDYDAATIFRAITIEQDSSTEAPSFALYRSAGFATSSGLICSGTMPKAEVARPGVIREVRYDRELQCRLSKGKTYPAVDFTIKATNLQNPRLTEVVEQADANGKTGWFVNGPGLDEHVLGKLNDGDAQILRAVKDSTARPQERLVSKYWDECGGFDCFMIELDLAYPKKEMTEIKGSFRYREDNGDGDYELKDRSNVRCSVKAL